MSKGSSARKNKNKKPIPPNRTTQNQDGGGSGSSFSVVTTTTGSPSNLERSRTPPGGGEVEEATVCPWINASIDRCVQVVEPEREKGAIEYKRQVSTTASPQRYVSLSTQMSFRLDEGCGQCVYRVGVEDSGCHSLLTYAEVAESCRILELIARSLNAVVVERRVIQNEVTEKFEENDEERGGGSVVAGIPSLCESEPLVVTEPSLLGDALGRRHLVVPNEEEEGEEEEQEDPEPVYADNSYRIPRLSSRRRLLLLRKDDPKAYTRAELTIQRVETHLLDLAPFDVMVANEATTTTASSAAAVSVSDSSCRSSRSSSSSSSSRSNCESKNFGKNDEDGNGHSSSSFLATSTSDSIRLESSIASVQSNGNNAGIQSQSKETIDMTHPSTSSDSNGIGIAASCNHSSSSSSSSTIGETLSSRNIRVAVVGNVDAGKSTLIGSLTTSMLDDGRGKCRTSIMKHRHEIETGRTSTATTHLMGFRATGEPIAGKDQIRTNKRKGEDEIARESFRVITLMDLAGHEKYLKTTIHGVSSGFADYSLILVNSRHPPTHMTQHHLNLCCSFGIPVIVIFTKMDGCPEHAFKNCKEEVMKMLRSPDIRRKPFAVRSIEDVDMVMDKLHTLAPMFETSCVTGEGIDLLQKMLFRLPKRRRHENKTKRSFEFLVEDIFFNVPGVGAVTSGFVNAGELTVGPNCHVYIGPIDDGSFIKTVAKSAHISRISTSHITAGQSACLAFALNKDVRKKLRRGMVVLKENPTSTLQFDAEICVLKGEGTTIRRSYQAYVHILNVRQSAFARQIEIVNHHIAGLPPGHNKLAPSAKMDEDDDGVVLRPGSRAKVRFEFAKRPEYIRPGMRMLFRDGRVRGIGIITAVPAG